MSLTLMACLELLCDAVDVALSRMISIVDTSFTESIPGPFLW